MIRWRNVAGHWNFTVNVIRRPGEAQSDDLVLPALTVLGDQEATD